MQVIKHDYVHGSEPHQEETWLEAILAGLSFLGCILVACAYIYILGGL